MSVAPAPIIDPRPDPAKPGIVPARPTQPRKRGRWIALGIVVVAMSGGVFLLRRQPARAPSGPPIASIRTAQVTPATVQTSIRISGVTSAANFVSLITPQLRGSRSDRLRDSAGGGSSSSASTSAGSAASSSNAAASGSGAAGSSTQGSGSRAGSSSARSASSAFQSATSRFGGALRGSTKSPAASTGASAAPSATLGANGLGTAADSLPGAGGGGGGGGGGGNGPGDFMLVLQDVISPGSGVKKNQVIAEFDRQYMLLRLDDYRASVAQSEAALKKRQADLEITRKAHEQLIGSAKGDLDKARLDLKTIPVLSAIDAERARLAAEQTEARYKQLLEEVKFVRISEEADLRNAELNLAQSRLELKRAEANTDRMVVKAPMDGLAVMQSMFRGAEFAQIQKGDQLWPGMFFMQVVNPSTMVINATVNQVDVDKLRIGSKAKVHFDAYPGMELAAHVESVAAVTKPGGARANFVREVPVRIKIDQMDPRVIPDLSVSADVTIQPEQPAEAAVPVGAVFSEGSLDKTYVMVQQPSGWERRQVELGARNHIVAAVKSGLRPGEVVALDRP